MMTAHRLRQDTFLADRDRVFDEHIRWQIARIRLPGHEVVEQSVDHQIVADHQGCYGDWPAFGDPKRQSDQVGDHYVEEHHYAD